MYRSETEIYIVGITGKAGAGKDTAANILIDEHGFVKLAFANPLKDAAKILFNFTDDQLYDPILKEEVDPKWGLSPRKVLQWLGTDILRKEISDRFFLIHMEQRMDQAIKEGARGIVISDVRFDIEAKFIKNKKGIVLNIEGRLSGTSLSDHITEKGISPKYMDNTITNLGTIQELHNKVLDLIFD
jgi:dephospho-CoA kinase